MDQEKLTTYTKQYGVRFSRRAKDRAAAALTTAFQEVGYDVKTIEGKKWLNKAKDYFFGNIKTAKSVIVVPLDTPERKFWHKVWYFPFDGNKTESKTMLATFIPIVIIYAIVLGFVFFGTKLVTDPVMTAMMSAFMFVLLLFLVYFMVHGIHNAKNYTRNSAGIIAALQIANNMSKDDRKKVAFVFTDKNKARFLGSDAASKELKEAGKNPNILFLDCIGSGSVFQIGYKAQNRKLAQELVKCDPLKKNVDVVKMDGDMLYQHALAPFDKAIQFSCGELDADGRLYVLGTGTGKDNVLDEDRVDRICDMITAYIQKAK